jgi:alkylhydroperoxidase family enzyme
MARVRLLAPAELTDEYRPLAEAMDARGGFINVYRAMAHSPAGMRHLLDLLTQLWSGALTPRLREIVILAVDSASDAPYPLGWHLLDGAEAGLTEEEMRAIVRGDAAAVLASDEAAAARFARAQTLDSRVGEEDYQAVAAFMDERRLVELTMLAGLYRLVACFANVLDVELDELPARRLARFRRDE